MTGKREDNWHENYRALHRYVAAHRHLPQKTVVEDRGLLNWWKYNKKCRKAGTLSEEQLRMLDALKGMISTEHTGGRKKKDYKKSSGVVGNDNNLLYVCKDVICFE